MCDQNQYVSLADNFNGQITWCHGCQCYSLIYNSILLSFHQRDMCEFLQILRGLKEKDFAYKVHGENRVLIKNQTAYMGICMNRSEVNELIPLIEQALELNTLYKIVYDHQA